MLCAALLAVLLLVQVIRLVWLAVTPLGPVGDWQARNVDSLSAESRLSLFSSFDPFYRAGPANTANVVTSLQLTLYGIRMNEGSGLGSAILAGPDGVQDSFAVGEEIQPGVTLDTVNFDHVIIDRGGTRESLYLDQSIPAETVGSDLAPSAPDAISSVQQNPGLANPPSMADAVGFAPREVNGKVTGIVLSPRGESGLLEAAGFRDGDIIVSVDGSDVTSTTDINRLRGKIVPGARVSVEVERGANRVPIVINTGAQ